MLKITNFKQHRRVQYNFKVYNTPNMCISLKKIYALVHQSGELFTNIGSHSPMNDLF